MTGFDSPQTRIERFLSGETGRSLDVESFRSLVGDASNRIYYRLYLKSGESRVLALYPEPFVPRELPYINISELLRAMSLRVPRIESVSGSEGLMVLEDLGDTLLQDFVAEAKVEQKRARYREAVSMLADLQIKGERFRDERYLPYRVAFDEAKFFSELDFFRAHFLCGLRGARLTPEELSELNESFNELARSLVSESYALCHRDYHSRNLMVVDDELVIIDFQDARQGPRAYDLVSLLNDSYVAHSPELVSEMVALFADKLGVDLSGEYDLAALQRNLKALGTFGFQIGERGNDVYLPYVEHTLALIRANLTRNSSWDRLRSILARHVEELR
jgi:aminoglycoside/choline kinase family phosphotransferase